MFAKLAFLAAYSSLDVSGNGDTNWRKFIDFKQQFDLEFADQIEDTHRYQVFLTNLETAEALTERSKGKARFGITKFMHLTPDEFKSTYLGYKQTAHGDAIKKKMHKKQYSSFSKMTNLTAESKDWRDLGAITPVKDQGQCGSCWAFSATEAVESGYFLNTNELKVLSPQQTTSCDTFDNGCNGGNTESAYMYLQNAGGLELESAYPYKSGTSEQRGWCKSDPTKFKVKVGDSTAISSSADGESDMLTEIQSSPMSVCVDAEPWQFYFGGVIDSSTCGTSLDHCVHLVGYANANFNWQDKSSTTSSSDSDYWIVKNSWNSNWGEEGYIRVKQGENACGIALDVTIVDATDEDNNIVVPEDDMQAAIDFVKGVAKGLGIRMVDECVDAGTGFLSKLRHAFALMQKKSVIDMAEAMKLIAEALEGDMPDAATNCENSEKDVKNLIYALSIIEHPKEFMYHVGHDLSINGVEIFHQVNAAVGYYNKGKMEEMGMAVGEALELILVGNPIPHQNGKSGNLRGHMDIVV